jgi:hypothetical protein
LIISIATNTAIIVIRWVDTIDDSVVSMANISRIINIVSLTIIADFALVIYIFRIIANIVAYEFIKGINIQGVTQYLIEDHKQFDLITIVVLVHIDDIID